MLISLDDFKVKAENFDLTKMENAVRVACGAFFFPHVAGKFVGFGALNPGIIKFFTAAGFSPPEPWVYLAALEELSIAITLTLGICTRFAALGSAALMAVAVYSLQVAKGFGWTWNTGGYEYPVFWGICSLAVALQAWKMWFSERAGVLQAKDAPVRLAAAQ